MSSDINKIKQMSENKLKDKLQKYEMKRWQESRGKNMEFTISTMNKYQVFYDDMLTINADGLDGMGVDQLTEPFISLGLAYSKEEVKDLIESVDDDGSGRIEFDEFLKIIHGNAKSESSKKITAFFKALANNDFSKNKENQNFKYFSFKTVMNILRRKNLVSFFSSNDEKEKDESGKILKAYSGFLQDRNKQKKFVKK